MWVDPHGLCAKEDSPAIKAGVNDTQPQQPMFYAMGSGNYASAVKTASPTYQLHAIAPDEYKGAALEAIHLALDGAGMAPGIGIVADLINAGLYALRGDFLNSGLSLLSGLPIVGQGVTAAKYGNKALNVATETVAKGSDSLTSVAKQLDGPKGNELPGIKPKRLEMNKHKPPCFKPGDDLLKAKRFSGNKPKLEKEFYRQLKDQQTGINKMTVGKYLQNRQVLKDLIDEHGHKKARRILTGGSKAQNAARKDYTKEIRESLIKSYRKQGKSARDAERLAITETEKTLEELAALHDPDMIAGGDDKINRLGNTNVNSSLGSQWSKAGRITGIDEAAEKALTEFGPNAQMNVELTRCK